MINCDGKLCNIKTKSLDEYYNFINWRIYNKDCIELNKK
jgi:hypothetical protein